MKKFTFGVFVWVVIQVVMMGIGGAANSLSNLQGNYSCGEEKLSPFVAGLMGGLVPIATLAGFWCWQGKSNV